LNKQSVLILLKKFLLCFQLVLNCLLESRSLRLVELLFEAGIVVVAGTVVVAGIAVVAGIVAVAGIVVEAVVETVPQTAVEVQTVVVI